MLLNSKRLLFCALALLIGGSVLAACAFPYGSGAHSQTSEETLTKMHWCGKPLMVFHDEQGQTNGSPAANSTSATPVPAVTPRTVTDWAQVRANLDFTVFLPASLPAGTCLMSASGTLHDPILGSNFIIGYMLPDHSSISLSEAPTRSKGAAQFACNPALAMAAQGANKAQAKGGTVAGQAAMQVCSGVRNTTHIVFSARGTQKELQQFFQDLRPDLAWIPEK
ncbi:hypothetical protein EPA93_25180 [Ktedonosporobacter rubrisoli]|uniref:Lipoprotein n=1 Tax=Ktedonosporobacter rubrisoli TaxID=2509675 RepID=A0A4P6JU11_KTERU|nr:hypothetical protein [Ktedonosporobacter rubrisoli]QBD79098.1 hypothetical protein EPA93_25180 [Ktedonosporobacter rubrisoli]